MAMQEQLAYLKAVIEGAPDIEPWVKWFARNDEALQAALTRGEYLHLKLERIKAIPKILERFGVGFVSSDRYNWLGGKEGFCRDCGARTESQGFSAWCPNGCFRLFWSPRKL
jgi:hypothetical protein